MIITFYILLAISKNNVQTLGLLCSVSADTLSDTIAPFMKAQSRLVEDIYAAQIF